MSNLNPIYSEELASRTFRVWADFWSNQETFNFKVPGIIHQDSASSDEVLIIASCSKDELLAFIEYQNDDVRIRYGYETNEISVEWMGHWCRFRVTRLSD